MDGGPAVTEPTFVVAEPDGHGHMVYTAWEPSPSANDHTERRCIGDIWCGRIGTASRRADVSEVTWQRRQHDWAIALIIDYDPRLRDIWFEESGNGIVTARVSELEAVR